MCRSELNFQTRTLSLFSCRVAAAGEFAIESANPADGPVVYVLEYVTKMLHLEVCESLDSEEYFGSLRIFQDTLTFAHLFDVDHTLAAEFYGRHTKE
jgi:hypothetical protein